MHKFYYDFIQKKCKNVKLLFTDTDSFIIEITNEDFDEAMFENKEFFDLNNFLKIVNIIVLIIKKYQEK